MNLRTKVEIRLIENGFVVSYQNNVYDLVEKHFATIDEIADFLKNDYWQYDLGGRTHESR
jgi:hypothetical protein